MRNIVSNYLMIFSSPSLFAFADQIKSLENQPYSAWLIKKGPETTHKEYQFVKPQKAN